MFFYSLYHQNSKHLPSKKGDSLPMKDWPEEWTTIYIKSYPRFTSIALPKPNNLPLPLSAALLQRKSHRSFDNNITENSLSSLLYYSIGQKPDSDRRMYPSAGARYQLEFYILILKKTGSYEPGVYHYNITNHTLIFIYEHKFESQELSKFAICNNLTKCQIAIVTTAVFARARAKYGEKAYRFALIEAGASVQNLSLCATALNTKSLILGGIIDAPLEKLLDIDGVEESIVNLVCLG